MEPLDSIQGTGKVVFVNNGIEPDAFGMQHLQHCFSTKWLFRGAGQKAALEKDRILQFK